MQLGRSDAEKCDKDCRIFEVRFLPVSCTPSHNCSLCQGIQETLGARQPIGACFAVAIIPVRVACPRVPLSAAQILLANKVDAMTPELSHFMRVANARQCRCRVFRAGDVRSTRWIAWRTLATLVPLRRMWIYCEAQPFVCNIVFKRPTWRWRPRRRNLPLRRTRRLGSP